MVMWKAAVGLMLAVALLAGSLVRALGAQEPPEVAISTRKLEKRTVLYTVHRGSFESAGAATGELYALAGRRALIPRGPASWVYLNNPQLVSSEHWLVEVRIPVEAEALKHAGTLGEFTDVKTLPAMEAVVAVKPEGQDDPAPMYEAMQQWMFESRRAAAEGPEEIFLTHAMTGDYGQMKTEIVIPLMEVLEKGE